MKQCGTVTEVNNSVATVLIERNSSCGGCTACKMGHEETRMEVEAINKVNAQMGNKVELDMEGQNVLKAAFIVYVIPLTMLVLGIVLGNSLLSLFMDSSRIEIYAALIGFTFMALSFVGIKIKEKSIKSDKNFVPIITAIIEEK